MNEAPNKFDSQQSLTEQLLLEGRDFAAFLFDMDGTVLSSIVAAERVWTAWATSHGLDVDSFLPTIHGVRAVETVRRANVSGIDIAKEVDWITRAEIDDVEGIASITGAADFLASLPSGRWAIVTSASRALAERRLLAAGLPIPALMVTSEDVERGKPAPDCFLLAARRLGCEASQCLVFEDAPAGIAAAEAAGAAVVVVTETHRHPVATRHPTIAGYAGLTVTVTASGTLELVASADGQPVRG